MLNKHFVKQYKIILFLGLISTSSFSRLQVSLYLSVLAYLIIPSNQFYGLVYYFSHSLNITLDFLTHYPCILLNLKISKQKIVKRLQQGFSGGAVVENLPANAGDTGSSPGLGRSHMLRSGWAHEPQLLSLRVWSLCSATREAAIVRGLCTTMKSGPRLPQLEKALAQKRRPNRAINRSINK